LKLSFIAKEIAGLLGGLGMERGGAQALSPGDIGILARTRRVLERVREALQVEGIPVQDGTTHENGNLLDNFDACVASLPRLLAFAHSFQEGQQGGNTQGRCHDSKGTSCGVTDVLIHVVNIRTHGGNHGSQTSSLGRQNYSEGA